MEHKTKEVDISVSYKKFKNGNCSIGIHGIGDFRHHLIEEILFLLADKFEMKDHLDIVINKLKVRLDNAKET